MKYWPASELALAPGMHPMAAYELRNVNHTGVISPEAQDAGYMAAIHEVTLPCNLPLTVPPTRDAIAQPLYLSMPDPWQFHKLERAGLVDLGGVYYFILHRLH